MIVCIYNEDENELKEIGYVTEPHAVDETPHEEKNIKREERKQ